MRKLKLGKHSGREAIRNLARKEGFEVSDTQIAVFLQDMRQRMADSRGVDANRLFENFLKDDAKKEGS